jgi:hypothetical protein
MVAEVKYWIANIYWNSKFQDLNFETKVTFQTKLVSQYWILNKSVQNEFNWNNSRISPVSF